MNTGEIIRKEREKKGWKQRELARRVGLNYSVMNRIELGTRPVEDHELRKFADVLEVSSDYLLGRVKDPHFYSNRDEVEKVIREKGMTYNALDISNLSEEDQKMIKDMVKRLQGNSE